MATSKAKRYAGRMDDGMARGMELVLTPALLGGIGYVLDRVVGVLPLFTILLAVFGVVGMFVRSYYKYEAEMRAHEARAPWAGVSGKYGVRG